VKEMNLGGINKSYRRIYARGTRGCSVLNSRMLGVHKTNCDNSTINKSENKRVALERLRYIHTLDVNDLHKEKIYVKQEIHFPFISIKVVQKSVYTHGKETHLIRHLRLFNIIRRLNSYRNVK
jgi:hypothetical protein